MGKATFKLQTLINNRHGSRIALPHDDLEAHRDGFDISDDEHDTRNAHASQLRYQDEAEEEEGEDEAHTPNTASESAETELQDHEPEPSPNQPSKP